MWHFLVLLCHLPSPPREILIFEISVFLKTYMLWTTKLVVEKVRLKSNLVVKQDFFFQKQKNSVLKTKTSTYKVCHRFRLTMQLLNFWVKFNPFWIEHHFWSSWGSIENELEPTAKPPSVNLACPNPWNALYDTSSILPPLYIP